MTKSTIRRSARSLFALAMLIAGGCLVTTPAAGEKPDEFSSAKALLVALEEADAGIDTLTADIRYDKEFKLQGDVHRRVGDLKFRTTRSGGNEAPGRAFEINFNSLQIGGRQETDPETWIFDGHWLVEMHPARKQFVKREIASEGAKFDPLAIGEGPMPIPIGQKADEVLVRFSAKLAPANEPFGPDDDVRAGFVADTWQLVLTPRNAQSRDEKFKEIRIWYSKGGDKRLLPRMARTLSRSGDISYVQLINIKTNVTLPARAFDVSEPPAHENWQVQVEPLPEAERRSP